ncbi:MAG: hypothetical protein JSW18_03605 [Candidatus Omnitrophota bacterium]|nr:MAG: hypothetical protein JSW18_03605 [Candidatus Omnitrophota bacterium]
MIKDDFARFRLDILAKSFAAGAVIIMAGLLFKQRLFSLGYLIGLLVSIAHFSNMYSNIRAISNLGIKRVKLFLATRYLSFYVILAFVLVATFLKDKSMFAGAVAGFLSIKIVIYVNAFISKRWIPHP